MQYIFAFRNTGIGVKEKFAYVENMSHGGSVCQRLRAGTATIVDAQ